MAAVEHLSCRDLRLAARRLRSWTAPAGSLKRPRLSQPGAVVTLVVTAPTDCVFGIARWSTTAIDSGYRPYRNCGARMSRYPIRVRELSVLDEQLLELLFRHRTRNRPAPIRAANSVRAQFLQPFVALSADFSESLRPFEAPARLLLPGFARPIL